MRVMWILPSMLTGLSTPPAPWSSHERIATSAQTSQPPVADRENPDLDPAELGLDTELPPIDVNVDAGLPKTMVTDIKRLQQIIKNLLSNAFKFTHAGNVTISIAPAASGWSPQCEELERAERVIAFKVSDTGIGISADKQHIIFEAFQQADGSTSRKYGGTGLGLAISRELSKLLGGDIKLASAPGAGSAFTLYLPLNFSPAPGAPARAPATAMLARAALHQAATEFTSAAEADDATAIRPLCAATIRSAI